MRTIITNFRFGYTSPRFAGRIDTEIYSNGADTFTNFVTTLQGSAKRRYPLKNVLIGEATLGKPLRIVEFNITSTLKIIIVLYSSGYKSFSEIAGGLEPRTVFTAYADGDTFTETELREACFTQYYDKLYMAHMNHKFSRFKLSTNDSIIHETLRIYVNQAWFYNTTIDDPNNVYGTNVEEKGKEDFKEDLLNTANHYPAICKIINERLVLASTALEPDTIWISRPYNTSKRISSAAPDNTILDFIQYEIVYTEKSDLKDDSDLPRKKMTDSNGNIVYYRDENDRIMWFKEATGAWNGNTYDTLYDYESNKLYNNLEDDGSVKQYTDSDCTDEWTGDKHQEPYVDYDMSDISELYTTKRVIRYIPNESTAIKIQMSTGKQDTIQWIGLAENIIIGTASSEHVMPSNISALAMSRQYLSSFGSKRLQPQNLGNSLLYVQRGNYLRAVINSGQGISQSNFTFTADDILSEGVVAFVTKEIPTPTAYFVMSDGTMRVFVHDEEAGINSWAKWTFGEDEQTKIKSLCILGDNGTQKLYALVDGGLDDDWIGVFDEEENTTMVDVFPDGNENYLSSIVLNRFDSNTDNGSTFGEYKTISNVILRTLNSGKFKAGQVHKNTKQQMYESINEAGTSDYSLNINGSASKEIRVSIDSVDTDQLEILAVGFDVGVNI